MRLNDFIENYICKNSLIRLWEVLPKEEGFGYKMICDNEGNSVCMEHEILNKKVWQSNYSENEVIGVNDIYVDGFYREAINIVIKTK